MKELLNRIRRWWGIGCWCCGESWEFESVVDGIPFKWCAECKMIGCKRCS